MENPVLHYNSPLRRSRMHALVLGFVLLLSLAFGAGLVMLSRFTFPPTIQAFLSEIDFARMLASMLFVSIVVPIVFLYFSNDYRKPGWLEEFRITRLSSREVAFGSIFWGIFVSLCVIAIVQTGFLVAIYSEWGGLAAVPMWGWGPRAANYPPGVPFVFFYLIYSLLLLLRVARYWLINHRAKWLIFFEAPFYALGGTILHALGLMALVGVDDPTDLARGGNAIWVMNCIVALGLIMIGIGVISARAGELYFRSIERDIYLRHDWFGRERASRRLPKSRLPGLSDLHKAAGKLAIRNFLIATVGMLVALNLIYLVMGEGLEGFLRGFPWLIVLVGLLATLGVAARQTWLSGEHRFVVVSGRLRRSAMCWYLPILPACLIASGFLFYISDDFTRGAMFYFASAVNVVVCFVMMLYLIPEYRRGRRIIVSLSIVLVTGAVTIMFGEGETIYWVGVTAFVCCDLVVVGLTGGLASFFFQQIHMSEVPNHPIGASSLQPPPEHFLDMETAVPAD